MSRKEKIMIVDNEPDVVELLEVILEQIDCPKISYTDPVEALKGVASEPIFVALVDFKMPHLNGLQFCAEAKKINPNLKFLIISGFVDADMVDDGRRLGIVDYFNKPIDDKKLLLKIQSIMKEREDEISSEKEIKNMFLDEVAETFSLVEDKILRLESESSSRDVIESLFRAFHNLKGGAASSGFLNLSRFAHGVENRLNKLRDGSEQVTKEFIEFLLKSNDVIGNGLEKLKNGMWEDLEIPDNLDHVASRSVEVSIDEGSTTAPVAAPVKKTQPVEPPVVATTPPKDTGTMEIIIKDDLVLRNMQKVISLLSFEAERKYDIQIQSKKIDLAGIQFLIALKKNRDFVVNIRITEKSIIRELELSGTEVYVL